jgi:hypothetical protein
LPEFSGTVLEIRLTSRANFGPIFSFFSFYCVFLIIFFRLETFLNFISDFSNKEIVAVLHMEK